MLKQKTLKMEVIIKNNPFVKIAPTTKVFRLLSHNPERLVMRALSQTNDVPYCDCFAVEEEWQIASPPGAKCCALRISYCILWYKSTMMKSIIKSNTESESKTVWDAYKEWILKEAPFKEKKKPVKQSKGIKYERVGEKKKRKTVVVEEVKAPVEPVREAENWQQKIMFLAMDIFEFLRKEAQTDPQRFMMGVMLVMLFWLNWKLGSVQS